MVVDSDEGDSLDDSSVVDDGGTAVSDGGRGGLDHYWGVDGVDHGSGVYGMHDRGSVYGMHNRGSVYGMHNRGGMHGVYNGGAAVVHHLAGLGNSRLRGDHGD
ncbi:hypothetical protein O0L34_g19007 [Tuta absoluta]|nr:hypothetical protein O0L34_g19007 [Tuta absoluta]